MLKDLKDFLQSSAGEVMIGFLLLFTGAAFWKLLIPKSDIVMDAGLTLIARAMVGATMHAIKDNSQGKEEK